MPYSSILCTNRNQIQLYFCGTKIYCHWICINSDLNSLHIRYFSWDAVLCLTLCTQSFVRSIFNFRLDLCYQFHRDHALTFFTGLVISAHFLHTDIFSHFLVIVSDKLSSIYSFNQVDIKTLFK